MTASVPSAIATLPARTRELAALLEQWAHLNSGSGHAAGLIRMQAVLRAAFAGFAGAVLEDVPLAGTPVPALRVRMRPAAPRQILLNGHFDTVYEADDPFQRCTRLDADRLGGPGVADMKGGIVIMLAALQAFEQTPHAARLGWEVLLTPDEETGSRASRPLFVEAASRHTFALIFEPARPNGDFVHSRKGTGGFKVVCHGRAGHAAKIPNDGRNAILALAEFLLAASRLPAELPGVLVNIANIRGGGPATNVVPDRAEAEADLRVTRTADAAPLTARLQELAAQVNAREGYKLELNLWFNRPPKECAPAEEVAFAACQQAGRDLGLPPFSWVHSGGASDGNFMTEAGLPSLDGAGVIGDYLHSNREYCVVSSLAQRAQLTALFLHRLAAGEIVLPAKR
jgi:glutamate carboxypeptidase